MQDDQVFEGEGAQIKIRNKVEERWQCFASLDGGIGWRFVGYLFEGKSFVGLPQFNALDGPDQEAVKQAIDDNFPNYEVVIVKPLPPHLQDITE